MEISNYRDILKKECPKPVKSIAKEERAAQFASFAALTGFDCAIEKTKRLKTGEKQS